MLQIVASLIDAARGVIYDRHMFIVQATGWQTYDYYNYNGLYLDGSIKHII
jgi:hypothetical protein